MKVRIIIEYDPDFDDSEVSDWDCLNAARKELADWKVGHVTVQDFQGDDPQLSFTINVEWER
jgi:hypothetical protein